MEQQFTIDLARLAVRAILSDGSGPSSFVQCMRSAVILEYLSRIESIVEFYMGNREEERAHSTERAADIYDDIEMDEQYYELSVEQVSKNDAYAAEKFSSHVCSLASLLLMFERAEGINANLPSTDRKILIYVLTALGIDLDDWGTRSDSFMIALQNLIECADLSELRNPDSSAK